MAVSITHTFVSAKGDGTDATLVRPSNWNAIHSTSMATGNVLGRQSAGVGTFEEIPLTAYMAAVLASVDANSFFAALSVGGFTTGDGKLTLKVTPDTSWLMMDDGTFGNVSSGSSNRNNADCLNLFTLIYNNVLDANAPLLTSVGGATTRGAQGTAATAFAAQCRMTLPKQLGRALVGAGAGSGLTARPLGSSFGGDTTILGITNLPPITSSGNNTITMTPAGFNLPKASSTVSQQPSPSTGGGSVPTTGGAWSTLGATDFSTVNAITVTSTGTTSTPFSIAQASAVWNVMVKL